MLTSEPTPSPVPTPTAILGELGLDHSAIDALFGVEAAS